MHRIPSAAAAARGLLLGGAALAGAGSLGAGVLLASSNAWISLASRGRVRDWDELVAGAPDGDGPVPRPSGGNDEGEPAVAVVLGAAVWPGGVPSPWLAYRLDAAAGLYLAGLVDAVVVSGDGRRTWRDEPAVMRDHLVRVGVPAPAIVLDRAGLDTYDTCVRALRVLGVRRAVLVSQDFHVPRAVAIARAVGLPAAGASDPLARRRSPHRWRDSWLRERPAAVKAAWDVLSGRAPSDQPAEGDVAAAVAWTREDPERARAALRRAPHALGEPRPPVWHSR